MNIMNQRKIIKNLFINKIVYLFIFNLLKVKILFKINYSVIYNL